MRGSRAIAGEGCVSGVTRLFRAGVTFLQQFPDPIYCSASTCAQQPVWRNLSSMILCFHGQGCCGDECSSGPPRTAGSCRTAMREALLAQMAVLPDLLQKRGRRCNEVSLQFPTSKVNLHQTTVRGVWPRAQRWGGKTCFATASGQIGGPHVFSAVHWSAPVLC